MQWKSAIIQWKNKTLNDLLSKHWLSIEFLPTVKGMWPALVLIYQYLLRLRPINIMLNKTSWKYFPSGEYIYIFLLKKYDIFKIIHSHHVSGWKQCDPLLWKCCHDKAPVLSSQPENTSYSLYYLLCKM